MPLPPSPLNPDHGLDRRPVPGDLHAVKRWIARRYNVHLSNEQVAEIIADANEGSALRHRLRWAFIHERWVLFLTKDGRMEPQSEECVPANGSHPYAWAVHVEGRRTPAPVYPGEPWDVDPSFAHIIKNGDHSEVYWDDSVEPGFVVWAHERYGLPMRELRELHLTARRHPARQHRKFSEILSGEMSPHDLPSNHPTQLWLNGDDVIVTREGLEVYVEFVPEYRAAKQPLYE
jgi:hypothetical protein